MRIQLKKAKSEATKRFHPWIFSGAIHTDTSEIKEGTIVNVVDSNNHFIAKGHFQPSTIAVRILTFEDEQINQSFFNKRIQSAVALRKRLHLISNENNITRLVHGEGDLLPGLFIDYYNKVAVIQCHSIEVYLSQTMTKDHSLESF